jgi:anthranilate/para-aminobenzoate synthase component II
VELPDELVVSARSEDGVVQGIRHRELPIDGVQFHPESVMTAEGKALLANFLGDGASVSVGGAVEEPQRR